MRKLTIIILMLLSVTLSLPAESRPDWTERWQTSYSEDIYLGAVGRGESSEDAETDAYRSLASYFGVSISSSTTAYSYAYTDSYDKSKSLSAFESEAEVSLNMSDIAGIRIAQRWDDGSEYYALALLDKSAAVLYYMKVAEESASTVAYYQNIDPSTLSFSSISVVQELKDCAVSYYEAKKIISVLAPGQVSLLPLLPSDSEILSLIDTLSYELSVTVSGESEDWYTVSNEVYSALKGVGITPSRGKARYRLVDSLSYEETTAGRNPLKFIKYSISIKIMDNSTDNCVFAWAASGREGQVTLDGAMERACTAVNKKIRNELGKALSDAFSI